MKFKVSAILPCPAQAYFVERDSAAFRSLVAQMCKLESLEMGNTWLEGEVEVYEFITVPDIDRYVPHQFKHFLPGGNLHYTDIIEYDPKLIAESPYRMRVHSIPPIFASKSKIISTLTIEEVTPETCRQTLEGSVEIKILGLGHVAERIVVDNLKNVYKGVPKIVERWVQFRNEVLKQPNGKDILVNGRPQNAGVEWINDQIRELIKADVSGTESASVSSQGEATEALPSVEEMMEQCSVSKIASTEEDDDEDVFFDAQEEASWANLGPLVETADSGLQQALRKDTRDAAEMLNNLKKSGRKLKRVEVDGLAPEGTAHPPGAVRPVPSSSFRFSKEYNQELHEWKDFWQEHGVPEAKHVSDFRARLGNLFGIGAALGMFKPGKQRFQLRRKHRHGRHKRSGSNVSTGSVGHEAIPSSASPDHPLEEAPENNSSKHQKGHGRSRNGTFLKGLFGSHKPDRSDGPDTG